MDEKQTATPCPRAVQIHEAGHALVAAIYGLRFERVTVKPDSQRVGWIDVNRDRLADAQKTSDDLKEVTERYAKTYYAGRVAEILLNGESEVNDGLDEIEARNAIAWTLGISESDFAKNPACLDIERQFCGETMDLLCAHRPALERIANELAVRDTLTQADIQRLIDEC